MRPPADRLGEERRRRSGRWPGRRRRCRSRCRWPAPCVFGSGNAALTRASDATLTVAAPTPCRPRPRLRMTRLGAAAQIAEAAANRMVPSDERLPPALAVGERRRGHDEHAHREAVGGDHPLQALLAGVEVLLDVGQGDVHDRGVEVDHEQADAGRQQGQPLAVREAGSHAMTLGRHRADVARATTGRGPGIMPAVPSTEASARCPRPGPRGGPGLVGDGAPDTRRLTAALLEALAHDEHFAVPRPATAISG